MVVEITKGKAELFCIMLKSEKNKELLTIEKNTINNFYGFLSKIIAKMNRKCL